jgi:hypothetical protein
VSTKCLAPRSTNQREPSARPSALQATRDQISGIGGHEAPRLSACRRHAQYDLADMARLAMAKRVLRSSTEKTFTGRARKLPRGTKQVIEHRPQQSPVGLGLGTQIVDVVADIGPQLGQRLRRENVALAEFEKPAMGAQRTQACGDKVAG